MNAVELGKAHFGALRSIMQAIKEDKDYAMKPADYRSMVEGRASSCGNCGYLDSSVSNPVCTICTCVVSEKTKVINEFCPAFRWGVLKMNGDRRRAALVGDKIKKNSAIRVFYEDENGDKVTVAGIFVSMNGDKLIIDTDLTKGEAIDSAKVLKITLKTDVSVTS